MPKTYDYDFRRKVIEAIELNGMTPTEASQWLNIRRNSINQWFHLRAETGDIKPRVQAHPGHGHKMTDWDEFGSFVEANPDKTQKELAHLWPESIAQRSISRGLKNINFTRKKN